MPALGEAGILPALGEELGVAKCWVVDNRADINRGEPTEPKRQQSFCQTRASCCIRCDRSLQLRKS
ncbi:MAG TPA: hypothetical protein DEV81_16340 [Cyanobacteria bacterium UBA11049]|nr:hypothetical protein [Cyanobacteria bacterium UBA11049]